VNGEHNGMDHRDTETQRRRRPGGKEESLHLKFVVLCVLCVSVSLW